MISNGVSWTYIIGKLPKWYKQQQKKVLCGKSQIKVPSSVKNEELKVYLLNIYLNL